ncbi:MAG: alpha/beta-type small acid-soluble spore protein [Firmicutes bacterium]|nr:alpha/beta-type small acid-soluble spore protein [Bacillota bacterium]MCL5038931.1 alpha/beta-type small acid-soluble spore protein [Bacillota bacterium]
MPRRNRKLVPKAERKLDQLKYEVADELGLDDDIENRGWENMTTREVGKIGGNMVRRMVRFAEKEMPMEQNENGKSS